MSKEKRERADISTMTTPLSSLLAAALSQSSGPSASTSASSQLSGNAGAANQVGSGSTPPAAANAALSRAVAIDNGVKVVVERLPERVLSISTSSNNAPSVTAQTLNVVLPKEVGAKLSKQAMNNAQLALLPQPTASRAPNSSERAPQGQSNAPSAVLLSTSLSQQSVSLSAQDKAELLKAVAQALAANNAAVTLKGKLFISTKNESFGQLMLATSKEQAVPLTDINTEKADSSAKAALQKLIGQQVVLGLSRTSNGSVVLQISQTHLAASSSLNTDSRVQDFFTNNTGSANKVAVATHKNVSTNLQHTLIEKALSQGGVVVEHSAKNSARLSALLQNSGTEANVLKALSALTLSDGKLTTRTAQQNALVQISLSTSSISPPSIPVLTNDQVNRLNLSQLPNGIGIGAENGLGRSDTIVSPSISNLRSEAPTQLKGSDVHNAITTLSRILLSQTGNTNKALSELIAIVENGRLPPNKGVSNAQHFDKILQHLKGLDALNAKPSQIKVSIQDFVGPPKPSNEQLSSTLKGTTSQAKDTINVDKLAEQSNLVKDNAGKSSLAALAQALSGQAKGLSSSLLSNIIQQLTASQNKSLGAPPTISDTSSPHANPNAIEGPASETLTADEEMKTSSRKVVADMNEQSLSQRLQQLISTQTLVTTPLSLTSPVNSSNFIQGLVALVQLALAGRAMQRQPSLKTQIDAPDSVVSKTLANMGVTSQPSRVSQDINQLDGRQQLLAQLKTLLSSHQQNKIANVDSRIQGQDNFYYILPSLSQHHSPPELLIKREQGGPNHKSVQAGQRSLWNITMKLDIGDSGQVLAKSKIDKNTITLDLYASSDEVLKRISDTLPYLKRRLTSLGLSVESTSLQRGHIPETLNSRPHQIFETRV
ncbi:flagellar hook-length control protein FliK [Alteromonas sp. KUL150]|uniref:flagellar hook-length control protein FliK n=1 Tax=Alteromonas sp. KUL150 TaxID=2480805 RepID=UPI001F270F49|nr:flagellar hook-length control protein FliK [Alteromonas sp. KUL150]